jgi:PBSX family phage terminase large subunit
MAVNSQDYSQKRQKQRGKGKPFAKGDPRINRKGAPVRGQSWRETVKRITDMTTAEAIEYVGAKSRIGRYLTELPAELPIKEALVFATIIAYGREPNARMLSTLMDREEGKPDQPTDPAASAGPATITLSADLIAPDFLSAYRDIRDRRHTEYVFYGGRGSTKSSFVSLAIIYLLVNNPKVHALASRQVKDTMRDSVFSQLQWAIGEMGLSDSFKCTTSPLEIEYLPTGQKIYFRGADDPGKMKSIKPAFGHIAILWLEELDQFRGPEAVRKIEQSVIRGGDEAWILKSFNPPRTANNWANRYVKIPKATQYQHQSSYLTVPQEWLGQPFIDEAEHLKTVNPAAYEHEYLGVANGTGGQVFENVQIRKITDAEIAEFDHVLHGADWGYFPDPFSFGKMHYDAARHTLYIFGEYRANKKGNQKVWDELVEKGLVRKVELDEGRGKKSVSYPDLIIADSAEPKSVGDFRAYGANVRGAEKGPDSVDYSIKWLQSLTAIVIDNERAPYHAEEFLNYELEQDKDGEFISAYPDKNNHAIDDTRYATNLIWRKRGQ